jgi:hypothetical protein
MQFMELDLICGLVTVRVRTDCPELIDSLRAHGVWDDPVDVRAAADRAPDVTLEYAASRTTEARFRADERTLHIAAPPGRAMTMARVAIRQLAERARQLRGLHKLHASAVELDGVALVFAGPTEAGKTSIALSLCRSHGARLIANDQTTLAVEPRGPLVVEGDATLNLRYGSLHRAAPDLARAVFAPVDGSAPAFYDVKRMAPPSVGLTVRSGPTPLARLCFVQLDAACASARTQAAGDRSDPTLIELRRRLYEELTRLVRGAMILPVSDGDAASFADFFPPDLDDAVLMRRRIELIDAIASRRLLLSVRGPLDAVIDAVLAETRRAAATA